jgi:hypothetical protein
MKTEDQIVAEWYDNSKNYPSQAEIDHKVASLNAQGRDAEARLLISHYDKLKGAN